MTNNNKKSKSSRGKYKNQPEPDFIPTGMKSSEGSPPSNEELLRRLKGIDAEVPGIPPIVTEHHNDPPVNNKNQVTPSTIAEESAATSAATSTAESYKTTISFVSESKFLPNRNHEIIAGADDTNGSLLGSPGRKVSTEEGKDQSPTTREAIDHMQREIPEGEERTILSPEVFEVLLCDPPKKIPTTPTVSLKSHDDISESQSLKYSVTVSEGSDNPPARQRSGDTSGFIDRLRKDGEDFIKNAIDHIDDGLFSGLSEYEINKMNLEDDAFVRNMIKRVDELSKADREIIASEVSDLNKYPPMHMSYILSQMKICFDEPTRQALLAFASSNKIFQIGDMIRESGTRFFPQAFYDMFKSIFNRDPFARRALYMVSLIPYMMTWHFARRILHDERSIVATAYIMMQRSYDRSPTDPFRTITDNTANSQESEIPATNLFKSSNTVTHDGGSRSVTFEVSRDPHEKASPLTSSSQNDKSETSPIKSTENVFPGQKIIGQPHNPGETHLHMIHGSEVESSGSFNSRTSKSSKNLVTRTTPAQPDKHDGSDDEDDDDDGSQKGHADDGRNASGEDGEHPTSDTEKKNHVPKPSLAPKKVLTSCRPHARYTCLTLRKCNTQEFVRTTHDPRLD